MSRRLRIAFIAIVLFAALAALGFFAVSRIPALRAGVMTPLVFFNFLVQDGAWRPLEVLTPSPRRERTVLESPSGRRLDAALWIPARARGPAPAAVIYTPFIGGGLEDPRLKNLAETFARAGIVSLAFWRDRDPLVASPKDIDDVVAAFRFLQQHPSVRPDAVGLVGISYGAGPALVAAARPEIRDAVSFVMSHAGYYDLENVLRFIVTGEYEYGDIRGKLEPNRYGHEILSRTLEALGVDDATAKNFTESPQDFDENFERLPRLRELVERLSPSEVAGELRAEHVYIIHATDDTFIPYTESLRLRDAFTRLSFAGQNLGGRAGRLQVRFQLIDIFEHGTPRPPTIENLRRHWIPNLAKSIGFLYALLRETYAL